MGLAPTTVRTICNRDILKIQETLSNVSATLSKTTIQKQLNKPLEPAKAGFIGLKLEQNYIMLKGEAASADILGEKIYQDIFEKSVKDEYSLHQIMNVDETGLCWKRMPARTFISKDQTSAPGHKVAKERLTLLLGGNAAGDFKFTPFLIYVSANPRAMKNVNKANLNLHWRSNKKAWMTASMFFDWVKNCCIPELKDYAKKKNIAYKFKIIVDNAPGHPQYVNDIDENVSFEFLPLNTTSIIQPMDQVVISNFKCYYLKRTYSQLLHENENPNSMKEFWKSYNILHAVENIVEAWKEVKDSGMRGVWRPLLPNMLKDYNDTIVEPGSICDGIVAQAAAINFIGMEQDDINEVLSSGNEELNNDELVELEQQSKIVDETQDNPNENKSIPQHILSNVLKLVDGATELI